ncbi:MAG: hypothetical protein MUC49_16415 [Raineya sp.]|jgi:predicted nuclease with TOPRIM domain|nr:hypothetical protein [Raineya sp.]
MDELFIYTSIASLIGSAIGIVATSYFTAKGKNLADKQDIAEITKKTEEVKIAFTKEIEKLKANLLLSNNIQFGLFNEERNAIVDFNEKYFKYLHLIKDPSLNGINSFDIDSLFSYPKEIFKAQNDCNNSQTRLTLFIKDPDIIQLANEIYEAALNLLNIRINILSKLISNANDIKVLEFELEEKTQIINNFDEDEAYLKSYDEKRKRFLGNNSQIFSELSNSVDFWNQYKIVSEIAHKFQDKCREYLYQLLSPKE